VQRTALLGRDVELARLEAHLRDGRSVAVVGEAGIGKTSLIRAAAQHAGLELREGGALATLTWTPFLALRRAVGDGFHGDLTAVAMEVERRIGPDLLFIDDLQWADHETRDVLVLLAGRVGLVTAIRSGDPSAASALELIESTGGEILELAGLDSGPAAAIVRRSRPSIDPALLDRVVEQAGGNPLLLEELATRGQPTANLSRALANRLAGLSHAARRSFALLALAGRPMGTRELGRAGGELRRSGIVLEADGQLAVRHALFAEAAIAALSEPEQRRLHVRLATLLPEPGERARHLAAAGRRADAAQAAQVAAGVAVTDMERAIHLELVAQMTRGEAGDTARIEAARTFVANGGSGSVRAIALLDAILEGPPDLMVDRDALLARAYWETGDLAASRAAFLRGTAIPVAATSLARARLDADVAAFLINVDGDFVTARRIVEEAISAGRASPRIMSIRAAIPAYWEGVDTFDDLLAAYEVGLTDTLDPFSAFRNARNVAFIAADHRGYDTALTFIVGAADHFAARDMAGRADDLRSEAVMILLTAGRLSEVIRLSDELQERTLSPRGRQVAATARALAMACLGYPDEARAGLELVEPSVTEDYEGRGEFLAATMEVEFLGGRPAAVVAAYEAYQTITCPYPAIAVLPALIQQWARFELARDPGPAIPAMPWPIVAGASPESDGVRALYRGDPGVAADRFAAAAAGWAGFHRLRELFCLWARGEAFRLAGSGHAESSLRHALELAEEIGFAPLAARARRSLRQAGMYVAPARPERAIDRSARMTGREREALQLVGRGLGTPEIARRMGLGRGTVDQILGAATRKVGASSRVQAAAILQREDAPTRDSRPVMVVRDESDAVTAVLAALDGADVAIDPTADPALADRVQDDLRRLGRADAGPPESLTGPALGPDELHLLARIAEGMSHSEAARSLHISRRTADRRLASARRALGVATTAEALVALQRRGLRPPD
jgi:DNA-binding CsgD family transcriptional regulator